jgi:hypothetical protein
MNRLFIVGSFAHRSEGVLAAIRRLTLVPIELLLNGRLGIPHVGIARELGVTAFADSEDWNIPNPLHESQIALCHIQSLAHLIGMG